jgi:hypothetical protein
VSSQRWSYTKEALSARHMEEEEEKRIEGAQNKIAAFPSRVWTMELLYTTKYCT